MGAEVVNGSAGPGATVGSRKGKARLHTLKQARCWPARAAPATPPPLLAASPLSRTPARVGHVRVLDVPSPPGGQQGPLSPHPTVPLSPMSGPAPGWLASQDCQRDAGGPLGRHSRRVEPPGPPAHSYRGSCTLGGGARAKYPYGLGCAEDGGHQAGPRQALTHDITSRPSQDLSP